LIDAHGMTSYAAFREVQYLRTWWYLIIILLPSGLAWWAAIAQLYYGDPWGNNPGSDGMVWFFLFAMGIFFPAFLLSIRMITVVSDALYVRFSPFMLRPRIIRPDDIASHRAEEYSPIKEYGGWGIKGFASNRAYNVSGRKGVRIVLKSGDQVMIGTQMAEELNAAISSMRLTAPRGETFPALGSP